MDVVIVTAGDVDYARAERFLPMVSELRRRRIERKRRDEDKLQALAAGLLVSAELSRRSGIPREKLRYSHGAFGKPYLIGSDVQFSLSHTKGAIVAAFEEGEEIGVDVERRDRRVSDTMYKRVLSEEERFRATSDSDFIRFWVQKEALLKRLGVGISRDLRGVNVPDLPDTTAIDCGDLFVGVSGKGALEASVTEITLEELLNRYTKLL